MEDVMAKVTIAFWTVVWLLSLGMLTIYIEYDDGITVDIKGWL